MRDIKEIRIDCGSCMNECGCGLKAVFYIIKTGKDVEIRGKSGGEIAFYAVDKKRITNV